MLNSKFPILTEGKSSNRIGIESLELNTGQITLPEHRTSPAGFPESYSYRNAARGSTFVARRAGQ